MRYILTCFWIITLFSCSKNKAIQNIAYDITTLRADTLQTSVLLTGKITAPSGTIPTTVNRGICWSLIGQPTVQDDNIAYDGGVGEFTVVAKNLLANKRYYARSFYKSAADSIVYGNLISFTRPVGGIVGIVGPAENISRTGATCLCTITETGGVFMWSASLVYTSRSNNPIASLDSAVFAGGNTGNLAFKMTFTSLSPNTTYYYRLNLQSRYNTPVQSFKTLP